MLDVLAGVGSWLATEESKAAVGCRWQEEARPDQLAPAGDWFIWLILAGRGWGKTRSCAEWCAEMARTYPGARIALVAATFADGRDTMVEGDSGLLSVLDDSELRGGDRDKAWNRSHGELFMANGSRFRIYVSEKPARLRGPQHHFAWCDEAAAWTDAHKGTARDTTWSNLLMGTRLKGLPGWPDTFRPRIAVATTPRPLPLLKVPDSVAAREPARRGIMQRPDVVMTSGKSEDNISNLAASFVSSVIDPLRGTTLGRQELDGELLEDFDGAFLTREVIERTHTRAGDVWAELQSSTRVVSVDPAVTAKDGSDETGIVVVGSSYDGNVYVLGDHTLKGLPGTWAMATWAAVIAYGASAVIVEDNQGGDMVEDTLLHAWDAFQDAYRWRGTGRDLVVTPDAIGERLARSSGIRPPIVRVHPSGPGAGKWQRAQPVRFLYEQGRVRHVADPESNMLERLEEQLAMWTGEKGEKSPDRIDALVHGVMHLLHPADRKGSRYGGQAPPPPQRWATMRGR